MLTGAVGPRSRPCRRPSPNLRQFGARGRFGMALRPKRPRAFPEVSCRRFAASRCGALRCAAARSAGQRLGVIISRGGGVHCNSPYLHPSCKESQRHLINSSPERKRKTRLLAVAFSTSTVYGTVRLSTLLTSTSGPDCDSSRTSVATRLYLNWYAGISEHTAITPEHNCECIAVRNKSETFS